MNINSIISELIETGETVKTLEKRAKELKEQIFTFAGNSDSFETDLYTVIIKATESIRLDTKALYNDFPDIKQTYGKTIVSRSIIPAAKQEQKTA